MRLKVRQGWVLFRRLSRGTITEVNPSEINVLLAITALFTINCPLEKTSVSTPINDPVPPEHMSPSPPILAPEYNPAPLSQKQLRVLT